MDQFYGGLSPPGMNSSTEKLWRILINIGRNLFLPEGLQLTVELTILKRG
jgi:hypothetical protein